MRESYLLYWYYFSVPVEVMYWSGQLHESHTHAFHCNKCNFASLSTSVPIEVSPRFVLAFLLSLPCPFGVVTRTSSVSHSGTNNNLIFFPLPLHIKYNIGEGNHWHLLFISLCNTEKG